MSVIVVMARTAGFQISLREFTFELPCYQILRGESRFGDEDRDIAGNKQLHRPFSNTADDDRLHALLC